jgi:membrane protease YdiL (CAAX protease family)
MPANRDLKRARLALAGCVALLAVAAIQAVSATAWAYPLVNTTTAVALLGLALAGGASREAVGLVLGRRTLFAAGVGVAAVAAVLATGWAVPSIREVFADSPAARISTGGLLWAVLVRVPFGTVLLEEVAFRGVIPALLGADGRRWTWRPVLAASALFGLFHLAPALSLDRCEQAVHSLFCPAGPVAGPAAVMVAAMGLGVVLCAVRHVGGGLLAPLIVHTAANSTGYFLAWTQST